MIYHFNQFHPGLLFFYYVGSIAVIMLLMHPIFLLIGFILFIVSHLVEDRLVAIQRWLFFMFVTGILIFVMNPLFNERGRTVLFETFGHRITLEAVTYGGMSALSIICIMMIFVSYNISMTPNKLLFLFSKILPQFALLLMLTLRFIPLMKRRMEEISAVQLTKGVSVTEGYWKNRVHNGMLYLQTLLTFSLEEAVQTADSMKARGYGLPNRTTYEFYRWRKPDILSFIYLLFLLIALMIGRIQGYGYLTIYPRMEPMFLMNVEKGVLLAYILFLSFPLLVYIRGVIKWHLLK